MFGSTPGRSRALLGALLAAVVFVSGAELRAGAQDGTPPAPGTGRSGGTYGYQSKPVPVSDLIDLAPLREARQAAGLKGE